jgi:hypothetical protein
MQGNKIHHEGPVRLSRNRNSEYLPQRRKGRKVQRLRVKIIYKSFCPFPITLAPWREEFSTPSTFDARLFAQAAQIFNYSNTKDTRIWISRLLTFVSFVVN